VEDQIIKLQRYETDKHSIACPKCGNPIRLVDVMLSGDWVCDHKIGFDQQNKGCPWAHKFFILPFESVRDFYFGGPI